MTNAVQLGNRMTRIQDGVTIGQVVRQHLQQARASVETRTVFMPAEGPHLSWQPASLELSFDPGSVDTSWQTVKNRMDYVPGKFRMNILKYPKVEIQYLGEPNEVPPSADPNDKGENA